MALTVSEFLDRFPEFKPAYDNTPAMVQNAIDQAHRRTPADIWGDREDDAQGWLAAHLLAISPFGREASLVNQDGSTSYGRQRQRLEYEVGPAVAPRVT